MDVSHRSVRSGPFGNFVRTLAAVGLTVGASGAVAMMPSPAAAQTSVPPGPQTPAANPTMQDSCGTNAVLVLDASGSISSSHAVDDVRDAGEAFLDALADTGSTARVLQFGSISEQLAAQAEVTAASLQAGGAFRNAINGYYNPIPPRPSGVNIYNYRGSGGAQSSGSWSSSNGSNQYTNWDQSLDQAGVQPADPDLQTELIVYVTDGDPTAYDFNQPGDPFDAGPPPDVGVNTNRSDANATTMNRAIQEANEAKAGGARMLAVGVGAAVTGSTASRDRLVQIAGPQVITSTAGITSINQVDVALIQNFDALAQFLRAVVSELCSPSLSIRKLAQTPDSADYTPAPDWDITVTPSVTGGTYGWILPDTDPIDRSRCGNPPAPTPGPRTCPTNASGLANFQWEPVPPTAATSASVSEVIEPGYTAGRPGESDWVCTVKSIDGSQRIEVGDFTTLTPPTFTLPVDPEEIITCSIFNSFNYAPGISLTKTDDPTIVRGDLADPVLSTFTVDNTGNASLDVGLTDDRCTPTYVSGDTPPANRLLDPTETWTYACTRTGPWKGASVTNTADVTGVDPAGTIVTDTAADTVDVVVPAIAIEKTASPTEILENSPTSVTYTYVVTNPGDVPLGAVTVTDAEPDEGTCAPVVLVSGDTANVGQLDPGEIWTYTCTASLTTDESVVNTATAAGVPVVVGRPVTLPNPPVVDRDSAVVTPFTPGLELTKVANQTVVYPGTSVTYTYTITNTGTVGLVRPAIQPPPPPPADPRDGWVVDAVGPTGTCAPVTYVSGDVANSEVLDPAETWTYTCTTTVAAQAINIAAIVAVTNTATPTPLVRFAAEEVDVVVPAIDLEKVSIRPEVLDPAGIDPSVTTPGIDPSGGAIAGPDVPLVAPAVYEYLVTNPGPLPLSAVTVVDTYGGLDESCAVVPVGAVPPAANVGDTGNPGLLDPGEAWQFECILGPPVNLTKGDSDNGAAQSPTMPAPVTNRAVASGQPPAVAGVTPPRVVSPTRTQTVSVIEPRIALDKTVDQPVILAGGLLTYTFTVTNPGDSPMDDVRVIDDRCDVTPTGAPNNVGDQDGDGALDPGEAWTFTCTAVAEIPEVSLTITNTATVLARGPLANLYADVDAAVVRVLDPAISLTKSVNHDLVPSGTQVTYGFDVENVGESPLAADDVLAQIVLLDASVPAQPSCTTPVLVSGDTGGDGLLPRTIPPEIWHYECTATIDASTLNLATVRGTGGLQFQPPLPVNVFDVDAAFVRVFTPAIEVVKTAAPTELPVGGGSVTYTYEVRNTGDVPLAGVPARLTDDRCAPLTYVSGDEDADGLLDTPNSIFEDAFEELWIFTCTTTIAVTTTNTVVVTGTPTDGGGTPLCGPLRLTSFRIAAPCDVTANDTAIATVLAPGSITVVKRTEPASTDSFAFLFGFTAFTLTNGGSQTFDSLTPGTYAVTELVPDGWQLASSICTDGSPTSAISVSAGESITCTFVNTQASAPPLPPLPPAPPTPPPTLPSTGSAMVDRIILTGGLSLLTGLAVLAFARRRRGSPDEPVI